MRPESFSAVQTYFNTYSVVFRTCSGNHTPHFNVTQSPVTLFSWYGTKKTAEEYTGKMQNWVAALTDSKVAQKTVVLSCMRNTEDYSVKGSKTVLRCHGSSFTHSVVITLPIMLPMETLDSSEMWDYPEKITIPRRGIQGSPVVYDLTARVFCSPAAGPHFIARTIAHDGSGRRGRIALYDDMANDGYAVVVPQSKITTHLAGPDEKLLPTLSPGYKTSMVLYSLRGGKETQERFFEHQVVRLRLHHSISVSSPSLYNVHSAKVSLSRDNVKILPDTKRLWYKPNSPLLRKSIDYETDHRRTPSSSLASPPPPSKPLRRAPPRRVPLSSSSSDKPFSDTLQPHPSHTPERLSTPARLAQARSSSPHPIRCRCGASGDGRLMVDGLDTIQCASCETFSHFACQVNGRANNIPRKGVFECDACLLNDVIPHYLRQDYQPQTRRSTRKALKDRLR